MKVIKKLFLTVLPLVFVGCSSSLVQYNEINNNLALKVNESKKVSNQFNNPAYQSFSDQCTKSYYILESSLAKYGTLYVRNLKLNSTKCYWNGLPEGFVTGNMKDIYNVQSVKRLKSEKVKNYEFIPFLLSNNMEVTVIEIWENDSNTFIFDETGVLTKELKQLLNK